MARQRFIWPTIWDDPDLGRLSSDARLLYIGCFSLADDDGRIIGDPTYLRTQIFRYRTLSDAQIVKLRDELSAACGSFKVYEKDGSDYIAFTNWSEFQKPKYPRPSKLPPPPGKRKVSRSRINKGEVFREPSGNGSGSLPEGSPTIPPRDGLGLYPPTPRRKRRSKTPKPPNPTFPCPHCGASQRTKGELDDHIRYVHFDQTDNQPANDQNDIPL